MPEKTLLYVASTTGHLSAFHRPYIKRLAALGWTVHTAAAGIDPGIAGSQVYLNLPFEKKKFSPKNFFLALDIAGLIRQQDYSLIITHTSLAAFFTRLGVMFSGRKKPQVVNVVHGYLFDKNTGFLRRTILLAAEKLTSRVTSRVIVMNLQDEAIAKKHRLSSGDVVAIKGMGVDTSRFHPASGSERAAARESMGLSDGDIVLVYAAEFSRRKNQQMLINALAEWREDVKLILPGTGALLEENRALASALGLDGQVIFPGYLTDMPRCLHGADIGVSASRSEGLPLNILESMACALPIVASAVKGNEDLITPGENGLLFPYDDAKAFREAVEELLSQGMDGLAQMGILSAETASRYALENVLETTVAAMLHEKKK